MHSREVYGNLILKVQQLYNEVVSRKQIIGKPWEYTDTHLFALEKLVDDEERLNYWLKIREHDNFLECLVYGEGDHGLIYTVDTKDKSSRQIKQEVNGIMKGYFLTKHPRNVLADQEYRMLNNKEKFQGAIVGGTGAGALLGMIAGIIYFGSTQTYTAIELTLSTIVGGILGGVFGYVGEKIGTSVARNSIPQSNANAMSIYKKAQDEERIVNIIDDGPEALLKAAF